MKIGVFDAGLAGISVVRELEKALPEHEIVFRHDAEHGPYGSKKQEDIIKYVEPILHGLVREGCAVIVIACNTVGTTSIQELRRRIAIHLVAINPLVEQAAALSKSKIIAVCATPQTLKSDRYKQLKEEYAKDVKVLEPNCNSWAKMVDERKLERAMIADQIHDVITLGADVIVLGLTAYQWVDDHVREVVRDSAVILKQDEAIITAVKKQLAALSAA